MIRSRKWLIEELSNKQDSQFFLLALAILYLADVLKSKNFNGYDDTEIEE